MLIFALILIIIHIFAVINPTYYLWGADSWSYFHISVTIALSIIGIISFLPKTHSILNSKFNQYKDIISKVPFWVFLILIIVVFFLFKQSIPMLGDGALRVRNTELGVMFVAAEPLDSFIHTILYKILNPIFNIKAVHIFNWISISCGVLVIIGIAKYSKKIFDNAGQRWFMGMLLLSAASVQLFFAYVESYSIVTLFLILYFLSTMEMLKSKSFRLLPIIFFSLAFSFHIIALIFLPSVVYAYYLILFKNENKQIKFLQIFKFLIIPFLSIVVILIIALISDYDFNKFFSSGENHFLPIFSNKLNYGLISAGHFFDIVNLLLLGCPGVIALPLIIRKCKKIQFTKELIFLIISTVSGMIFIKFFKSDLGFSRDWDLFSVAVIPFILLLAHTLIEITRENLYKISIPLITISLIFTLPWIILNSSEEKSLKRMEHLVLTPYWNPHAKAALYDELSVHYYEKKDLETALVNLNHSYKIEKNYRILDKIAIVNYKLEYFEIALKNYLTLAENGYKPLRTRQMLGVLYFNKEDYSSAVYEWEFVRKNSEQNDPKFHYNLALCYYHMNNLKSAINEFNEVLKINQFEKNALNYLSEIYFTIGNFDEAINANNKLLQVEPDNGNAYFNLALCYASLGRFDKALENIRLAKRYSANKQEILKLEQEIMSYKRNVSQRN